MERGAGTNDLALVLPYGPQRARPGAQNHLLGCIVNLLPLYSIVNDTQPVPSLSARGRIHGLDLVTRMLVQQPAPWPASV